MMLAKGYKALIAGVAMLALAGTARAQNNTIQGWCQVGGIKAVTQGMTSSNTLQGSYPRCSVTVYLTGTSTKATLHTSATGGSLTNPFTANADGSWLLWAANGAYDVVMVGGTPIAMPYAVTLTDVVIGAGGGGSTVVEVNGAPISPASPANFVDSATVAWDFTSGQIHATAGAGGCTGSLTDTTSTNCGTGNQVGNTGTHVSTFGYTNVIGANASNGATAVGTGNINRDFGQSAIGIGTDNLQDGTTFTPNLSQNGNIAIGFENAQEYYGYASICLGFQSCDYAGTAAHPANTFDILGIGWGAASNIGGSPFDILDIGKRAGQQGVGYSGVISSMLCIGDSACYNPRAAGAQNLGNMICFGDNACDGYADGSYDVIAIGMGASKQCNATDDSLCGSLPLPGTQIENVLIGGVAGSYNQGNDVVAVGENALGSDVAGAGAGFYNSGNFNSSVGAYALVANSTGQHNTAVGGMAGADGYVYPGLSPGSWGNSNHTGSNNTWVGYDSGPNTTTQLSNTVAVGVGAHVSASNSAVYGNSSITQTDIYGTTTIHGAGTINGLDVPGGTDDTGTLGHYKLWASTANGCWMFTNGTSSPACISTGGGGTPGGSNTQVQFNNSGVFGGSANFEWTGTSLVLPLDTVGAIHAGTGAADPFTTWNFDAVPVVAPASSYRQGFGSVMSPTIGVDDASVHWSAVEALAFPGDNHNYHNIFGGQFQAYTDKSGSLAELDGGTFGAFHAGSGTVVVQIGNQATSVAQSTGAITTNTGVQVTTGSQGTGTITTNYGVDILSTGSGPVTTNYGLHIAAQTNGATNYNLFSAGATTQNYFEGTNTAKTFKSISIADGCATWASNVLGSTGVACGSGGGGSLPSGSGIPTIQSGTTWGPTIPSIPVEAYGAVGNASCASAADSTTAIQNAINALPATGGNILLQPLCYRVSATLTFSNSFTGIVGYTGFVYFGGSRIESTSASADIIDVAGASSASIISQNRFSNFSIQRSVAPTGTAKGLSLNHVGSTILEHIGSADSINDYYFHDARGVTSNYALAGFGNNGFTESSGTYSGFYVDTADGLPSNSFISTDNGVACTTSGTANVTGFNLVGAAINDHQHTGFNIGGNCQTGVNISYTGAGSALTAYDIHFFGAILDAYKTNAIKVSNVPASATASIEFNGGWTNGTGTAIDIESSAGVSVSNMQINCSSCTNAALVNGSTGFVFNTNQWIGAPTTHLALTGASHGSVTGNSFSSAATNGISADATSSSNTGFPTNSFGTGVTNTILDTGSNPQFIRSTNTSGGILQQILDPSMTAASGNFVANFVGGSLGDGVVYAWRNNTVHNASLETWASGFPIRLSGSIIGLEGGPVYVGNSNSTASNTDPSGGGLFNVGTTNQFQVSSAGAVTALNYNGVALTTGGGASTYLDGSGNYSTPSVGAATVVASSETVASSATPTFSTSFNVSYNILTANVTSFTLAAGSDGQAKTLTFCQNGTGGFTVAAPANVHGFFTVGTTASKCSSQHFNYSTAQTAWLADSPGVINQ